jgi:hypothetical protein
LAFFQESFDCGQGRPVEERAGLDGAEAGVASLQRGCDGVDPALGRPALLLCEPFG